MSSERHRPYPFVILSGSYCAAEIASEYGKLPPSFLPVGNRRLYQSQIDLARACYADPVISLPADYVIPPTDLAALKAANVRIIRSPVSLSLTEAIQFVLEVIDAQGPMYLLFGDTLVDSTHLAEMDHIAVHQTQGYYNWSYIVSGQDGRFQVESGYGDGEDARAIVCGFFAFSDAEKLRQAFASESDFASGINAYLSVVPMRAMDVAVWYDFGHLALIYQSKRNMLISRSFNSVSSDGIAVIKTSTASDKMAAEANWYEAIPPELRIFTPQFLGRIAGGNGYKIEYLYMPTVAELYTFGNLPVNIWKSILNSSIRFIHELRKVVPEIGSDAADAAFAERFYDNMFVQKTHERVNSFLATRGWRPDICLRINDRKLPPFITIIERLIAAIAPTRPEDICLWHGDFFFGNMLYDFRAGRIKVIDPRGGDSSDNNSIFGDWRYDVAKLAHSVIGGYDVLLADRVNFSVDADAGYRFEREQTRSQEIVERQFRAIKIDGAPLFTPEIQAMTSLLFLTMLPLHADSARRQDIMLCNGLHLAQDFF